MEKIAEGLYLLEGFPPYAINIYLMRDVLIDAGTPMAKGRILRQLSDRDVTAHALTHAHPDHQGASKAVCQARDIPLWCGAGDADAMESGDQSKLNPMGLNTGFLAGPAYPVDRRLKEGDEVAGFTVVETPGHSPGHVSYWRESDGTLVLGDVLFNMNLLTPLGGLSEPPRIFTVDPALNRDSARKIAALGPKTICFGHGKPVYDCESVCRFIEGLK